MSGESREKKGGLTQGVNYAKIEASHGGYTVADGRIYSSRPWLCCPVCGARINKLLPQTEAKNLVVYCKKCRRESIVNIESVPEP